VSSAGESFVGPKALGTLLARLKRRQRAHSRKVKGSNNRRKSAQGLARLHDRITCVRTDGLHKITTHLTKRHGFLAIEDLNVAGMLKNHKLARHLADASFGEFRRQLEYNSSWRGVELVVVGRFFASSKTCSECGTVNDGLTLKDRTWTCGCGAVHDRDVNAAQNILVGGKRIRAAGVVASACGAESAGSGCKPATKLSARKQEVKHKSSILTTYA
jgi:putative transposase